MCIYTRKIVLNKRSNWKSFQTHKMLSFWSTLVEFLFLSFFFKLRKEKPCLSLEEHFNFYSAGEMHFASDPTKMVKMYI